MIVKKELEYSMGTFRIGAVCLNEDETWKDDKVKPIAAEAQGISNCPFCAIGADGNKTRIYKINEMDADHVSAWSKGGATDISNCQMLCKSHNRAKGNK